MKSLDQYLIENVNVREFKLKFAGIELTDDVLQRIEHALKAFDLDRISKPKHLPFGQYAEFAAMGVTDVNLVTVAVKYPCTDEQLRNTIVTQGRIPAACVHVVPENQQGCEDEQEILKKSGKALLGQDLEDTSKGAGQQQVGTVRADNMLKDLQSFKHSFEKPNTEKAKTSNDLPVNTKSPIGSAKSKKGAK